MDKIEANRLMTELRDAIDDHGTSLINERLAIRERERTGNKVQTLLHQVNQSLLTNA